VLTAAAALLLSAGWWEPVLLLPWYGHYLMQQMAWLLPVPPLEWVACLQPLLLRQTLQLGQQELQMLPQALQDLLLPQLLPLLLALLLALLLLLLLLPFMASITTISTTAPAITFLTSGLLSSLDSLATSADTLSCRGSAVSREPGRTCWLT